MGRTEAHRQELHIQLHSLWGAGTGWSGRLRHRMFPEEREVRTQEAGSEKGWSKGRSMVSNGLQQDMEAIQ